MKHLIISGVQPGGRIWLLILFIYLFIFKWMKDEATFLVSLPNSWCLISLGLEEKRVHRVFVKETVCVCLFFVFLKILNGLSVLNMLCPWRQNRTCWILSVAERHPRAAARNGDWKPLQLHHLAATKCNIAPQSCKIQWNITEQAKRKKKSFLFASHWSWQGSRGSRAVHVITC